MPETTLLDSLQPDRIMKHMSALCKGIGPRPAASEAERRAGDYVQISLRAAGVQNIAVQPFRSNTTLGAQGIPIAVMSLLAALLARRKGWLNKAAAAGLYAFAAHSLRQVLKAEPPVYQPLIAWGNSQNVIGVIPPLGEVRQRITLIGHLDSNKQRFLFPTNPPSLLKPIQTVSQGVLWLNAAFSLLRMFRRRPLNRWDAFTVGLVLSNLIMLVNDEQQPYVEGANDNASAVAVLLGIAEQLAVTPLKHTEVTLLFTGCEEVGCIGLLRYLERNQPPRQKHYFIDLEMVGTGNICYVTKHGVSHLTAYTPDPELEALAERAATKHLPLAIAGKDMLIVEEVATLDRLGYKALCIAGYNQEGYLPNWHRVSDKLENIQPGTLSRAAQYTWALMQEIDQSTP